MSDALLSPAVGGAMWAATSATVAVCARRLRQRPDDRRVALMGVLGAFLFTAQMINFAIPGTGSSGHLGGGLLLAILVGPHAAVLVMSSVLIVQALFFADGGLLALGSNIFNLAFFPAFVGYPLYRAIEGGTGRPGRRILAATAAAVVSLELGALAVVLQTVASGISALPLGTFLLFMLPIHLGIGVVEGLVTAAIVAVVLSARPASLYSPDSRRAAGPVVSMLLVLAVVLGGVGVHFASQQPDGLEWSVTRVAGDEAPSADASPLHRALARTQQAVAVLPDYDFRASSVGAAAAGGAGASVSGLVGGTAALVIALAVGLAVGRRGKGPE